MNLKAILVLVTIAITPVVSEIPLTTKVISTNDLIAMTKLCIHRDIEMDNFLILDKNNKQFIENNFDQGQPSNINVQDEVDPRAYLTLKQQRRKSITKNCIFTTRVASSLAILLTGVDKNGVLAGKGIMHLSDTQLLHPSTFLKTFLSLPELSSIELFIVGGMQKNTHSDNYKESEVIISYLKKLLKKKLVFLNKVFKHFPNSNSQKNFEATRKNKDDTRGKNDEAIHLLVEENGDSFLAVDT